MAPEKRAPADRGRKHLLRLGLPALLGLLSALLSVGVVPAVRGSAGPTEVALRLVPGAGETQLRLTPLGTIAADTHVAPARLELSLVEADIEALARSAVSSSGRDELREEVKDDLRRLALKAAIQLSIGVCLLAAAASALVFGRRIPILAAAAVGSLVGAGVIALMIIGTFDLSAFAQPSFSGALAKAQQVIDVVARGEEALDEAKSRFDVASDRLSELFVLLAQPDVNPRTAGTVVLHVSDIHANPIGFEITRQLAQEFDADAILDTGDLASSALDTGAISTAIDPVDSAIAREIGKAKVPYIYIAGNHDSPQLRRRVAEISNVEVLDGSIATVDSLRIMGWADPTFSITPVPESEKSEQRLEMAGEVSQAVAEVQPDVLAVHDSVLASESLGIVPVVVAGHTHERGETVEDGTLVLTVGSTGATGLKNFTVEASRRYEAEILYFEGDRLLAVDYVSLADIGGDFELSRRTYDHERQDAVVPAHQAPRGFLGEFGLPVPPAAVL